MAASLLALCAACFVCTAASYMQNDIPKCEYQELPCESGQCVDRTSWCDGPPDCFDDSDEKYCRTFDPSESKRPNNLNDCSESRYFQCLNGMCIPKVARCNDMPDCQDGEDEENCDYLYESNEPSEEDTKTDSPTSTASALNLTTTSTTTKPFVATTTTEAPPSTLPSKYIPRGDTSWIPSRFDVLQKSIHHLLEQRDALWGWGRSTPRMVTALYLSNASYFDKDNYEGLLTKKQLEVQLALDLMRHNEKPLRMHDLVHYVHALLATCVNPRDFHGVNVVKLLKKAMGRRQTKGLFVSPLAHLALCNAGDAADPHLRRLKNMAYRRNEEPRWLDVQTYALLAISCFAAQNSSHAKEWRTMRRDVAKNISEWQQADGGLGSIHSTGLALQALIAAEEPGTETAKGRAMTYLLMNQNWQGVYGNELDNYYVMPALNMKSLASVHHRKCRAHAHDTQGIEGERSSAENAKHTMVHYSLWIGGDKNEIQTLTLAMPRHSNFLDVMEAAQKLNPHFKHEFLTVGKKTTVHAIAGRHSDIERGVYWTLYRKVPVPFRPRLSNTTATEARLKLLGAKRWTKDLRKLHPRDGENLAFWYKPYL
ncbi:hypothetical protein HNY73_013772 [Argiope bruennichi]|uniref:Uncharacterized protein n=1 Tax=Argiope bruennichi TaxID=94029 RepID=A0A8T0ES40_ARGBR|nr:hypothetical protein HNY73_013772 [Argiope bruennichi]